MFISLCHNLIAKAFVDSLRKYLCPNCLVLVGSRNSFEYDITIKEKSTEGLVEH